MTSFLIGTIKVSFNLHAHINHHKMFNFGTFTHNTLLNTDNTPPHLAGVGVVVFDCLFITLSQIRLGHIRHLVASQVKASRGIGLDRVSYKKKTPLDFNLFLNKGGGEVLSVLNWPPSLNWG